jgi:carbamoyl-phosphate synthase small subunit
MTIERKAYLLLEDGFLMEGHAVGKIGTTGGEICFNTGMTGYQEIYTDPSYAGQIVVNTASHIGNYGTIDEEQESNHTQVAGVVINDFSEEHSRKVTNQSLQEYFEKNEVVAIAGLDTRMLVRYLRSKGAMNALISSELTPEQMKERIKQVPSMVGLELSSVVSTKEAYYFGEERAPIKVAVLDLGIKKNILRNLAKRGCYCKIFPAKATFAEMAKWNPDGYFISNGPGDPAVMEYAVTTVKEMLASNKPLFGICLGHQILGLASGLSTYKMHHGHRGLNHPVKNLLSGKGEMTSQNHGFAISDKGIEQNPLVEVTHLHLNDNTIMGIRRKDKNAFSVQYHPEASPGPHDSAYLFDEFIERIKQHTLQTA